HLQLQVCDDGAQVGIATALAVSVDAALHVGRALLYSRQSVCDSDIAIIMCVDAENTIEATTHLSDDFSDATGKRSAIGVAQTEDIGAGLLSCFQRAQREIRIGVVAVKEMFGIVDQLFAVLLEKSDGLGNQLKVLLFGDTQGALGV